MQELNQPDIEPTTLKKRKSCTTEYYNLNGSLSFYDMRRNYRIHVKFLFHFEDVFKKTSGIYSTVSPAGERFQISFTSIGEKMNPANRYDITVDQMKTIMYLLIMNLFISAVPSDLRSNQYWMFTDYMFSQKLIKHKYYNGLQCNSCYLCWLKNNHPEVVMRNSYGISEDILPKRVISLLAFMFGF